MRGTARVAGAFAFALASTTFFLGFLCSLVFFGLTDGFSLSWARKSNLSLNEEKRPPPLLLFSFSIEKSDSEEKYSFEEDTQLGLGLLLFFTTEVPRMGPLANSLSNLSSLAELAELAMLAPAAAVRPRPP